MTTLVADMTKEELTQLIESVIEYKLLELFGDPDEGLELRQSVHDRLLQQQERVAQGERGRSFNDVMPELDLEDL